MWLSLSVGPLRLDVKLGEPADPAEPTDVHELIASTERGDPPGFGWFTTEPEVNPDAEA